VKLEYVVKSQLSCCSKWTFKTEDGFLEKRDLVSLANYLTGSSRYAPHHLWKNDGGLSKHGNGVFSPQSPSFSDLVTIHRDAQCSYEFFDSAEKL